MSNKRKNRKTDIKRMVRSWKRLADDESLHDGEKFPPGAIPADQTQQVPNNSYSPPPSFYVDLEFVCRDCGRKEIWTALQQKWYYEVAKGSLYATAVRCRKCRRKRSENKGQGDPNPIKSIRSLMKRVRSDIEPYLIKAGFQFDGMNKGTGVVNSSLEYSHPGFILRCLFIRYDVRLIAETLDGDAEYNLVANVQLGDLPTEALLERISDFTSAVREFIQTLTELSE